MTNTAAAALRTEINHLAVELELAEARKARAEVRSLKLAIRAREFTLSGSVAS